MRVSVSALLKALSVGICDEDVEKERWVIRPEWGK
jgi:hypothetical protein